MAIDKLKTKFFTGAWLTDVKHYFTKINEIIDNINNNNFDFESLTYTELLTLKLNNNLIKGTTYFITDKADAGIIVQATSGNTVSLQGKGLYLVPDFQDIGTYTMTPLAKGTNHGVWYGAALEAIAVNGDIVFVDGLMYQVVDDSAFNLSAPYGNPTAYSPLTKNVTNGYILECDIIEYDFKKDEIILRKDKRGNDVIGYAISYFQWGNDLVFGNKVINSTVSIINQRGGFDSNVFINSNIELFDGTHSGEVQGCVFISLNYNLIINLPSGQLLLNCQFNSYIGDTITLGATGVTFDKDGTNKTANLDMSDPAIFSAGVLTIPLSMWYASTFILTGNTGQTISKIVNLPSRNYDSVSTQRKNSVRFYVEVGNTQSFQNVAVAGPVANTLNADAVATNAIIGRTNSPDYIEYAKSGTKNVRVGIVKLV